MEPETSPPVGCELCNDQGLLVLRARCHLTAPLQVSRDGDTLILSCYLPSCRREVARFDLAAPKASDTPSGHFTDPPSLFIFLAGYDAGRQGVDINDAYDHWKRRERAQQQQPEKQCNACVMGVCEEHQRPASARPKRIEPVWCFCDETKRDERMRIVEGARKLLADRAVPHEMTAEAFASWMATGAGGPATPNASQAWPVGTRCSADEHRGFVERIQTDAGIDSAIKPPDGRHVRFDDGGTGLYHVDDLETDRPCAASAKDETEVRTHLCRRIRQWNDVSGRPLDLVQINDLAGIVVQVASSASATNEEGEAR